MKIINFVIISLTLVVLTFPLNSAYGATCPYWKESPLIISNGELIEIECYLQNMVGNKDITLFMEITSGKEIATLNEEIVTVPFGREDIINKILINIPENDYEGKTYKITISYNQIQNENSNQMVQFNSGITNSFPVVIKSINKAPELNANSNNSNKIYFSIIIIMILITTFTLIILIIQIKKLKNKQNFLNRASYYIK